MKLKNFFIDEKVNKNLKRIARVLSKSEAEIIRESITRQLKIEEKRNEKLRGYHE